MSKNCPKCEHHEVETFRHDGLTVHGTGPVLNRDLLSHKCAKCGHKWHTREKRAVKR